jgi:hypothetical protein
MKGMAAGTPSMDLGQRADLTGGKFSGIRFFFASALQYLGRHPAISLAPHITGTPNRP